MFTFHQEFILPKDNEYIFRYLDLWKFRSLLIEKALYFHRVDLLQDKYEGYYLDDYIKKLKHIIQKLGVNNPEEELSRTLSHLYKLRKSIYVNCWCRNSYELATMWGSYCKFENEEPGIAIRTNIGNLKRAFSAAQEDIRIGKVRYLNYRKSSSMYLSSISSFDYKKKSSSMVLGTVFSPFLHKQQNFKDERELRCLFWNLEFCIEKNEFPDGVNIPINVEELIETIYIDPRAPKAWIAKIKGLVQEYGYHFDVKRSLIAMPPSSYPYTESIK